MLLEILSRTGDAFEAVMYCPEVTEGRKGYKIKGQLIADRVTFDIDPKDTSAGEWAGCKFSGKVERKESGLFLVGEWMSGPYRYVFELALQQPDRILIDSASLWDAGADEVVETLEGYGVVPLLRHLAR